MHDQKVVLGTLTKGSCDQFSTDLMVGGGDIMSISHTSKKATVCITGYKQEDIFSEEEEEGPGSLMEDDSDSDDYIEGVADPEEDKMKKEVKSFLGKQLKSGRIVAGEIGVNEWDDDDDDDDDDSFIRGR